MLFYTKMLQLVAALAVLVASAASTAAEAPLQLGVFPNLSPRVLMDTYQPLANYLGHETGKKVELQSAPGFREFHLRTMAGDYDLVITAPHLAWLAWKRAGYRPLLAYNEPVKGLIVVRKDSPIKKLADLKGTRIATADALAIVVLRMERMMEAAGLHEDRDFVCVDAGTHNNAALQAQLGQTDAAIVGALPFRKLPEDVRNNLRVIAESAPMPSQVWLAGRTLTPQQETRLLRAANDYMNSATGRQFLANGGFGGVHRLTRTELNQVAEDAKRVERMVGGRLPSNMSGKPTAKGVNP